MAEHGQAGREFVSRFEPGPWEQWSVHSTVDSFTAIGDSLGEAMAVAIDAADLGFTAARPTDSDRRLADSTTSDRPRSLPKFVGLRRG